jgi:type I site-specific restriction endonuclease
VNPSAKFANFQDELGRLVQTFDKNFIAYQQADYDETSLRNEFLNPLFEALGWDVSNRNGLAPHLREVRVEVRGHGTARQKRADYEFRIDRQEKFVCEAKRPHEQLHDRYIFQAKNYA